MAKYEVTLNYSQERVVKPRIGFLASDSDWNGPSWENTWIEPVKNTLLLRPNCMISTWHTTASGLYARWGLSDFGLSAGDYSDGHWSTKNEKGLPTPTRLIKTGMTAPVYTTFNCPVNSGVYVSYFPFNVADSSPAVYFECGWQATSAASGVYAENSLEFRFWSDGLVEVYEESDGAMYKTGDYTFGNAGGSNQNEQTQSWLILPCRRKEVLIYNITEGAGEFHVIDSIADQGDYVIHAALPFFFEVPSLSVSGSGAVAVDVELAPLKFPTSGYATTKVFALAEAPTVGRAMEIWENDSSLSVITNAYISGDAATNSGGGSVSAFTFLKPDYSTSFVQNGTDNEIVGKITLATADQNYSPFIYGAQAGWGRVTDFTSDEETDITSTIQEAQLVVPDEPFGTTFTFTSRYDLFAQAVSGFPLEAENWPIRVSADNVVLFEGTTSRPQFIDGEHGGIQTLTFECKDRFYSATQSMFRERVGLDGLPADEAIDFLLAQTSLTYENASGSPIIPQVPMENSEWAYVIDIGDTISGQLEEIRDTYFPEWFLGTKPALGQVKAYCGPTSGWLPQQTLSLFRTSASASASGDGEEYVYYDYSEMTMPLEANEVRVTGWDPRKKRPIQAYKVDEVSQDCTLAWELRPTNWLGEPRVFGYSDPKLTNLDIVKSVTESIFAKVTQVNRIVEFTSSFFTKEDLPIWRGDMVYLDDRGEYIINSMTIDFISEMEDLQLRKVKYTAGALLNSGGLSAADCYWKSVENNKTKYIKRQEWLTEQLKYFTVQVDKLP